MPRHKQQKVLDEDGEEHVIIRDGDPQTPPDEDWVRKVCRAVRIEGRCCRYLTQRGKKFSCNKLTPRRAELDRNVASKIAVARGDNCTGRASRWPVKLEDDNERGRYQQPGAGRTAEEEGISELRGHCPDVAGDAATYHEG